MAAEACIYCENLDFEYVGTVWDTDLGAYCEEYRCLGCGVLHGEWLLGSPNDDNDDVVDDEL